MSRIGKRPVVIPQGVRVDVKADAIVVEGPLGKLTQNCPPDVRVKREDEQLVVTRKDDSRRSRGYHGLYRNLIDNMITGVSTGFSKALLINGVGYRAEVRAKSLVLNIGYSSPIEYPIPEGVTTEVEVNNRILVKGFDKQQVGQVCAEIRAFRPPEPYKGKGIRYETEQVKRKIGKSGIK